MDQYFHYIEVKFGGKFLLILKTTQNQTTHFFTGGPAMVADNDSFAAEKGDSAL